MKFAVVFIGTLCIASLACADTTYVAAGDVAGVWEAAHSPYFVQGNIRVSLGDSLRIEAGVQVRFTGSFTLTVNGRLQVMGMPPDSVVFTAPQGWLGMQFWGTTELQEIRGAVIENVGLGAPYGAIYCVICRLEVSNTTIRNGLAIGGRAFYGTTAQAKFDSCDIVDNEQGCGCGGAVLANGSSRLEFSRCRIRNSSATDGGAFCLYESELVLRDCVIEDNTSIVWGGAIYAEGFNGRTTVNATNTVFRHNHSSTSGVYYGWQSDTSTYVSVQGCQFIENSSTGGYSDVSVICPAAHLNVDRCTFVRNGPGLGGSIRTAGGAASIRNSIFAYTWYGAAVVKVGGTMMVTYCDFYGNGSGDVLGLPPGGFGNEDTINANGDPCDTFGNIFLDPSFVDTTTDNYRLTAESACVDAGDPASVPDPDGSVADMGALPFEPGMALNPGHAVVPRYGLEQNYPNPFNATTTISFELPRAGEVLLNVFDVTGRSVATLAHGVMAAGAHQVNLDAAALPSGVYVYRLEAGDFRQAKKLVLLR